MIAKIGSTIPKVLFTLLVRVGELFLSWTELAFVDGLCAVVIYLLYSYVAIHYGLLRLSYLDIFFVLFGLDLTVRTLR